MQRVPEPELMDDALQAEAYAGADFDEPNRLFTDLFAERFADWPARGAVLDLGCGPGDIALRFARAWPDCEIHALDGSPAMLAWAERALEAAPELAGRVRFIQGVLPGASLPREIYDALISNSLLHHLHEPGVLWEHIAQHGGAGAPVLVMDLMRPDSRDTARQIVAHYAGDEPEVLQQDFYNSLLAAFEIDEVREQLRAAGLGGLEVWAVSDRHLAVAGRLGEPA